MKFKFENLIIWQKAKRREYISIQEFNKYYDDSFNLMNMMNAFKKKIN